MHRIRWADGETHGAGFAAGGLWLAPEALREPLGLFGIALAPQQAVALMVDGPRPLVPGDRLQFAQTWVQWEPDTAPILRRMLREPTHGDPAPRRSRLALVRDDGESVAIGATPLIVGRHPACGLVVADRRVSAFHALLVRDGDSVLIVDLASTNGTLVNDVRIQQVFVDRRAVLRLGGTQLMLVPELVPRTFAELPSLAMQALFKKAARVARAAVPVLISGESGVGKEVLARFLHGESGRSGPLVALNAAVLTRELAQSELFGHVRGAFTGAERDHAGAFRAAHGGTLFLDEIAELSLEVQAELLRVVELGRVRRLGETQEEAVDVRIVTASHRDLAARVRAGQFREDLFHRLCVVPLHVPPLRERPEDVVALAEHFLGGLEEPRRLSASARDMLLGHEWPGNARELLNTLRRAIIFAEGPELVAEDIVLVPSVSVAASDEPLEDLIFARVLETYARSGHSVAATAKELGLRRALVHRILKDERRAGRDGLYTNEARARYRRQR